MTSAGKVSLTLNGDYDASLSYDRLCVVNHDGSSWISKKDVPTGEAPSDSNTEYWQRFGTAVDMSNLNAKTLDGHGAEYFLPKSGGTLKGDLNVQNTEEATRLTIRLQNKSRQILNRVYEDGIYRLFDMTNNSKIIESTPSGTNTFNGTASGNLPLENASTPTVKIKNGANVLNLESSSNGGVFEQFTDSRGFLGAFGFNGIDSPVVVDSTKKKFQTILHTGNKPTGTYTGNGSATQRTINTGGIGDVCFVWAIGKGATLLHYTGGMQGTNNVSQAYFRGGNIYIETANEAFNASGVTYYYQVL